MWGEQSTGRLFKKKKWNKRAWERSSNPVYFLSSAQLQTSMVSESYHICWMQLQFPNVSVQLITIQILVQRHFQGVHNIIANSDLCSEKYFGQEGCVNWKQGMFIVLWYNSFGNWSIITLIYHPVVFPTCPFFASRKQTRFTAEMIHFLWVISIKKLQKQAVTFRVITYCCRDSILKQELTSSQAVSDINVRSH